MSKVRVIAKTTLVVVVMFMSTWIFQHGRLSMAPHGDHDSIRSIRQEILKLYNDVDLSSPNTASISPTPGHSRTSTDTTISNSNNNNNDDDDDENDDGNRKQTQPTTMIFRKHVTLSEIDHRFCPKTRDSCEDDCQCADSLTNARTVQDWENALKQGSVKGKSLFKSYEYVFQWEEEYLSKPPLKDMKELPNFLKSKVWFLEDGERPMRIPTRNVFFRKYQRVSFRVDLVNGYGVQRPLGGDEVRGWIEEDPSTRSGRRFSSAGIVTDLKNGSYTVTVTPVWTGLTHLYIAVVYPREYIRAALHQARLGSNRFIYGRFKNEDAEEVTVCHATPNVPGRSCICNYTDWNIVPFYCGRPLDKRLTCNDWVSVWPASQPPFKQLTSAESQLAQQMSRTANESIISHNITITVIDTGVKEPLLQPCSKIDKSLTWTKQSPRGYWTYGPHWTSLICREPVLTPEWAKKCLRSTQLWLIGDSNVVRVRMMLCTLISCKYIPHYTKWPDSLLGINEGHNITIIFRPHEHPLYLRLEWMGLYLNGGIRKYLRSVPSTGKHIIILHYYLHLASSHLSALYYRLVNLRDSLQELFERNNDVIVGIRGPHISTVQWQDNHMFGGDVLGSFMIKMLHEVLEDLRDRVVFLDGWDMSIGIRNAQLHPSNNIPTAMIRTMLAHKCHYDIED